MELLGYIVGLLTALVSLVMLIIKLVGRSAERESVARLALEGELRSDIKDERDKAGAALFRIGKLEEQRTSDLALIEAQKAVIEKVTGQVETLLSQMATMQTAFDTLQDKFDGERRENERLTKENRTLEKQNADLFEANKLLQSDNKTMRELVALLGLSLADDKPDPPPKPPKSKLPTEIAA